MVENKEDASCRGTWKVNDKLKMIWCGNLIYTPSGWSKNQFKENNDDSLAKKSVFITKRFIEQSFNIYL